MFKYMETFRNKKVAVLTFNQYRDSESKSRIYFLISLRVSPLLKRRK